MVLFVAVMVRKIRRVNRKRMLGVNLDILAELNTPDCDVSKAVVDLRLGTI